MTHQNPPIQILKDKDLYVFDMDGTIYLGSIVFDFAIRFIENLRAAGKRVLFFTNNASAPPTSTWTSSPAWASPPRRTRSCPPPT